MTRAVCAFAAAAVVLAALVLPGSAARADTSLLRGYLVVLTDQQPSTPGFQMSEADRQAALKAVTAAGGTVVNDMSQTIGVLLASSSLTTFAPSLDASALVESVGRDAAFKGLPIVR